MLQRFTSRKFLLAIAAQIVGILVLFWPEHGDTITEASTKITSLLLMALTAWGFIKTEGEIDAERVAGEALLKQTDKVTAANNALGKATELPLRAMLLPLVLAGLFSIGCAAGQGVSSRQVDDHINGSYTPLIDQAAEAGVLTEAQEASHRDQAELMLRLSAAASGDPGPNQIE